MAAATENTPASSSTFDEDVKKLMGKGKVHLVCNENLEAVKCFEEATKKIDEKYGEAADESGDAYFYYGKSLLEVARMEGGVLGHALQGAIDSKDQENGDGDHDVTTGQTTEQKTTEQKTTEQKPEQNITEQKTDEKTTEQTTEQKTDEKTTEQKTDEKTTEQTTDEKTTEQTTEQKTNEKTTEQKTDEKTGQNTEQKSEEVKKDETTAETEDKKDKELFVGPDINELDEDEKEQIGRDVTEAMTEEAFKEAIREDAKEKQGKLSEENKETLEETKKEEKTTTEKDEMSKDTKPEEKEEGMSKDKKEDEEKMEDDAPEGEEAEEGEEGDEAMEGEETEENVEAEPTEEEEPTYMELAWQMLEVARIIFEKRENKEGKLMLAQCHLKLGEIQMEQEQFLNAVEDFLKCLDIQKEHLEPENRLLAETAYNIGLAFSFQGMHQKSRDYYSQALETIELRIKNLEKSIDEQEAKSKGKEKATGDNPLVANRKELQELQELYPEIKAKVDDASEMMKQAKTKPDVSSVMGNGSSTTIGFGNTSNKDAPVTMIATKKAPVAATDISHLVHRNKRKPEEPSDDVTAAKKPRQDPEATESNGNHTSTNNGKPDETPIET